jgi:retron-type reverse transcriptase
MGNIGFFAYIIKCFSSISLRWLMKSSKMFIKNHGSRILIVIYVNITFKTPIVYSN